MALVTGQQKAKNHKELQIAISAIGRILCQNGFLHTGAHWIASG
jgi:hypothetical protein